MKIKLKRYVPADPSVVDAVEKRLGVVFPEDYRDFLLKYDGARPEDNAFDGDPVVSVDRFIPVAKIVERTARVEGFPKDAWAVASCYSGNFIYIRKTDFAVYFWDHEVEDDKRLAGSFSEFLQGLQPFDLDSIELKPENVISVWVDPDFKPEFD
ncbi:SMI1/KNR4 family protein [bacterium]|nr:SMI1/KNR4 family protein [bacterium]